MNASFSTSSVIHAAPRFGQRQEQTSKKGQARRAEAARRRREEQEQPDESEPVGNGERTRSARKAVEETRSVIAQIDAVLAEIGG